MDKFLKRESIFFVRSGPDESKDPSPGSLARLGAVFGHIDAARSAASKKL
ncbi:MAG: hypothetical protein ABR540_05970 [Acidimicrobiales bacterium]